MGKKSLFGEEEGNKVAETIRVNAEFAGRFEHNKKREELHRLKEKYPEVAARLDAKAGTLAAKDDLDGSSSEEEDDGYIPDKIEKQILETLVKIRNKDSSIYDKEAKFYSEEDDSIAEAEDEEDVGDGQPNGRKPKKKEKPMYLKDMVFKEAMDRAAGVASPSDSDSDEDAMARPEGRIKSYNQEQDELKKAFLQAFEAEAANEDGEVGGMLKTRRRHHPSADNEGGAAEKDRQVESLLDAYFGSKKKATEDDDAFLKTYILNRGWVETERTDGDADLGDLPGRDADDYDEDEANLEAAEVFEAQYNFRFEEPGGSALVSHPRQMEGTVRKEDDRRKRKRVEKAERKAAEEEGRRADLKRLKNLKKGEILERLQEVKAVAGAAAPDQDLLNELLAGDFDPEAHDKAMAAAFGDEYYGADGAAEDLDDVEDEAFDRELAAMADYGTDDEVAASGTFKALQNRLKEETREGAAPQEALKQLIEEYHKLDYEDHVGGIPTRFRYKEVKPETYGLSLEEILVMDDKELNQVVGLKRVAAPYRYDRMRPNYGKLNEMRRTRETNMVEKQRPRGKNRPTERRELDPTGADLKDDGVAEVKPEKKEFEKNRRLASFEVPTLKKKRLMHSEKERRKGARPENQAGEGTQQRQGLTKAQKKNMKRAGKRAAKRVDEDGQTPA